MAGDGPAETPLARLIAARIRALGPITMAEYMQLALQHPQHGYYRTRDPLGARGDFVTAPEVSQMFGELVGLWCADLWRRMGAPARFVLCELGPGHGTLIADALRATRAVAGFHAALSLHLVETSEPLRRRQEHALAAVTGLGEGPRWHEFLASVPDGPLILVANELFDALPVHQLVRAESGWRERVVALDGNALAFGLGPPGAAVALLPPESAALPPGAVAEVSPASIYLAEAIAGRVAAQGGAALVVDYGYGPAGPPSGATLQAMRRHAPADLLTEPGSADLTAHVDFGALARAAERAGARIHGPVKQGAFLAALGLAERAAVLLRRAGPAQAREILAAKARLLDPGEMGTLFKVLAIAHPGLAPPAGFPDAD